MMPAHSLIWSWFSIYIFAFVGGFGQFAALNTYNKNLEGSQHWLLGERRHQGQSGAGNPHLRPELHPRQPWRARDRQPGHGPRGGGQRDQGGRLPRLLRDLQPDPGQRLGAGHTVPGIHGARRGEYCPLNGCLTLLIIENTRFLLVNFLDTCRAPLLDSISHFQEKDNGEDEMSDSLNNTSFNRDTRDLFTYSLRDIYMFFWGWRQVGGKVPGL